MANLVECDRINESFLLNRLPLESRLYLWPFLVVYLCWLVLAAWYTVTRGGFNELLLIPMALACLAHFLTFMSIFWSVKADASLGCKKIDVASIKEAEWICVVPKEHNGKAGIVRLCHDDKKIFFTFHQQMFIFDADRKQFKKPVYPDQELFSVYRSAKGLETKESISHAQDLFGPNR